MWTDIWLGVVLAASFGTLVMELVFAHVLKKNRREYGVAVTFLAWLMLCCFQVPFVWLAHTLRLQLPH